MGTLKAPTGLEGAARLRAAQVGDLQLGPLFVAPPRQVEGPF